MKPRQDAQVRVIAGGIVLALLLHPFASAQEPVPPQVASNQSQMGNPASSQPDAAHTAAGQSLTQPPGDQFPDSPGTVQVRPSQQQALTPRSAQTAQTGNGPSSAPEPTALQQSDRANDPAALAPPPLPQLNDQVPDMPGTVETAASQAEIQPSAQVQEQHSPHEPLGTAAAEWVPTTGVAASRPAGAAVAPAKQRRVRSYLIKFGALVGAGVAVGATMALSQGSPSKPPGSR